ncbi:MULTISPECIES: M23 family metallopeptidase [Streptomyces]|uniref:Peptidase M23 n=2 Tax=Streptomyces TaxID=1883 RepID=A0A117IWC4_9ACTN|nr:MULTISPECIES: M23 family metallopeptidase [Streptomyces]KUH37973.1 peptidase M23 [Streptomyces kanasensis]UUS32577.1 M23 family metallopeptidase [Streptomyces changanensis]
MNDQHPHAGYVGDDAYATGSFTTGQFGLQDGSHGTGVHDTGHPLDTGAYDTGAYQTADPLYGTVPGGYDAGHSGQYDTSQWTDTAGYAAYPDQSGQWDTSTWTQPQDGGQYAATTATYDTTGQWYTSGVESFETGAYDATAWNAPSDTGAPAPQEAAPAEAFVPEQYDYSGADDYAPAGDYATTDDYSTTGDYATTGDYPSTDDYAATGDYAPADGGFGDAGEEFAAVDGEFDDAPEAGDAWEPEQDGGPSTETFDEPVTATPPVAPRPVRRAGGTRGRRRTPARRSALLTVAVPSACVMGVAGIAAASVSGLTEAEAKDDGKAVSAADQVAVKPVVANSALDTQLAALDAEALDFSDRASRTQERIDLKARQEAERKKREEEAKRREAMRPKFALPVALRQLSAGYGQAGVNWMSLHTGIDFPVQYGTPVMAATDGTVRTQWNGAYGNMVIVTAKDGTETWYCHLSSAKIRSGPVKAGDVIAYSGNSGNSTGPHLHFEVRPGGGAAIDPESWLRSHGLNPRG